MTEDVLEADLLDDATNAADLPPAARSGAWPTLASPAPDAPAVKSSAAPLREVLASRGMPEGLAKALEAWIRTTAPPRDVAANDAPRSTPCTGASCSSRVVTEATVAPVTRPSAPAIAQSPAASPRAKSPIATPPGQSPSAPIASAPSPAARRRFTEWAARGALVGVAIVGTLAFAARPSASPMPATSAPASTQIAQPGPLEIPQRAQPVAPEIAQRTQPVAPPVVAPPVVAPAPPVEPARPASSAPVVAPLAPSPIAQATAAPTPAAPPRARTLEPSPPGVTPSPHRSPPAPRLARTAAPEAAPPAPAVPAFPRELLPAPSPDDIARVFASAPPAAQRCAPSSAGAVEVTVVFRGIGAVSSVSVAQPLAGTPAAACIARAFRGASVTPFSRSSYTVARSITMP